MVLTTKTNKELAKNKIYPKIILLLVSIFASWYARIASVIRANG